MTNRCAYDDNGTWRINGYAEARDAEGEQDAYAFIPGVPLNGNGEFVGGVSAAQWLPIVDDSSAVPTEDRREVPCGLAIGFLLLQGALHSL